MNSYIVTIEAIEDKFITVVCCLCSTQVPDLPLKKNILLQFITDAYIRLTQFEEEVAFEKKPITEKKIAELLKDAANKELTEYNLLLKNTDTEQSPLYTAIAQQEIQELELLFDKNWELVDEWAQEIYDGIEHTTTTIEAPSSSYRFKVNNPNLLNHLAVGLTWNTSGIWDRDE